MRGPGITLALSILLAGAFAGAPWQASAQEITLDGNWILLMNSPAGSNEVPINIAQDGEELTVTLSVDVPEGQEFEMEGYLSDQSVNFFTVVDYEGMPLEITLDGTVQEDGTMGGMADYGGMAQGDWRARRAE